MKIDATKLREYLDSMHSKADARDLQSAQIRGVVSDAKKDGFDTKALRKVFVRERMSAEKRENEDALVGAYEQALGPKGRALKAIEAGVGVGAAADAHRVHRATLARARKAAANVANEPSNATPHDPETGEIKETEVQAVPPGDGEAPASNDAAGTPSPSIEESCGDEGGPSQPAMRGEASAFVETGGAALAASPHAGVEPGPQDTDSQSAAMDRMVALGQEIDADDLAIPPFLRGSRQRVAA